MKKIAIVLPSLLPVPATQGGAVETLIWNLININEEKKIYKFIVFSVWDKEAEKKSRIYKYTSFYYFKANKKFELVWNYLYRILKKFFKISIPDKYVRLLFVKKLSQIEYDWAIFEAGEVFSLKAFRKYINPEKTLVHAHGMIKPIPSVDKYFKGYLSISKFVQDYWMSKSNRSIESCKIWKNCINVNSFKKTIDVIEKNSLKNSLNINSDDFVIMFIGRIIPEKGVLELIKSLNYIKQSNIKILIIGSANFAINSKTKYECKVQEEIRKHSKKIVFTGYVPNTDLYKYYSFANVLVVPSMWQEPAGLVLLEAMASSTPIITTGNGGMKEYIEPGTAIVIDANKNISLEIAKSISILINNKEIINSMIDKQKEVIKKYDLCHYIYNLEKIINEFEAGVKI